jgi:multidrug resistance efflux pump
MRRLVRLVVILLVLTGAVAAYWYSQRTPPFLTLTGVVTTNEIVASSQIAGRIGELRVVEGDRVAKDQVLAVLQPDELREERAFYEYSAAGLGSQVRESEAALRLQERQTRDQIAQAEATLASTESQQAAVNAELENARITLARTQRMLKDGIGTAEQLDQARTNHEVAKSRV